ncbi:hypothetical protein QQS21_003260 [Conoideocrella luteorostrata]|uniref:BZIP domain-containing protein n=1 Tax=Conoideocrella luteorostrata TaxID=1105319 RepID=A0AAJ0CTK7_9HYPO|nr:hypothetical protein QQS21_003260 [Conoideocrella luteorostrata]
MNSAKAELERRRERGRLAQSAFRSRQARAKQDMKAENAILKNAIGAIAREICADDRPALRAKIREAAVLAGLDISSPNDNDSTPDSTSKTDSSVFVAAQMKATDLGQPVSGFSSSSSSAPALTYDLTALSHPVEGRDRFLAGQRNSHLSVLRDPFQCNRCQNGPATLLPFLGAGAFTFAGRMFWYLVEKYEAAKHDSLQLPARATLPKFRDLLDQSTSQNIDPVYWIKMTEARLARYRQAAGSVPPTSQDTLVAEEPTSAPKWLSPILAEQRIRHIVGDHVFAVLAAPMLDRWEVNRGNPVHDNVELIEGLLDRLSELYECSGDGPRWNASTFDWAVGDWCRSIIGAPAMV